MAAFTRNGLLAGLLLATLATLAGCSGGNGGDSAQGVDPGPPPPGEPVAPPPPNQPTGTPYAEAEQLFVFITSAQIPEDGRPVIEWQLSDRNNVAITDLEAENIRFTLAKLQPSPLGNFTGTWQSYVNRIETAGSVGPGTEDKLQATSENGSNNPDGFTNNGDGTYRYRFATAITSPDTAIQDQADNEGLDLSYQPDLTHRVAMQFDGALGTANPIYDWVPATGTTSGISSMDIAATDNCNRCHDPLALHGGNRQEVKYCVTCHNAGSSDANSGNTVDMKVMIHKIHRGANLPSVQAGGEYAIWGFRDTKHDYSGLRYPQDIRNCVNCHVGSGTVGDRSDLTVTSQGDNWSQVATRASCGSCHDDVDFDRHRGGQPDDSRCSQCHSPESGIGPVNAHRILVEEASARFAAQVEGVTNSRPGRTPIVTVRLSNPVTGEDYDLANDPVFTGASVNVRMSWDTVDYTNTGNGADNASSVSASAFNGSDNGDGSYAVTMPIAIPDGSMPPGVAAGGSGVAVIEGRLSLVLEEGEEPETVPLVNVHGFFSIDEADGMAAPRRTSVELSRCLACHGSLSLHGGNRTDNIDSCVTCHNPRNTDREVREIAATPPTDGKDEESLHFKTMIHGIHAAAMRESPLQVVGFQGRTTYVYDEETVHYPGNLANCLACHTDDGFTLPLPEGALATTVDTGRNHQSPADDTVVTPVAATCSSCHDGTEARAHMVSQGANFATSQAAIDSGEVIETCTICHGEGNIADVAKSHDVHDKPL